MQSLVLAAKSAICRATNLVDQKNFEVGISRAGGTVTILTNDCAINERAGVAQMALARHSTITAEPAALVASARKTSGMATG